jgi:hypothetical protein
LKCWYPSSVLYDVTSQKVISLIFCMLFGLWYVTYCSVCPTAVRTQIIQPPVDTQVLLGHTATLQCKVSSDPTVPFDIAWFHNNE